MKICVLASGSKGNCTYVEAGKTKSLIDIGMSTLYIENSLISLGVNPDSIENIFITHTHVDHIAGLKVFLKKHNPTVYLTNKMYLELSKTMIVNNYILLEDDIILNDLTVSYFKTSHDTSDSVGYIFTSCDKSLVYVTDTGYINVKNHNKLLNKDMYIFESNHDIKLLMDNPNYPHHTKVRIQSDKGHLSNEQSSKYLSTFVGNKTKYIVLAHLSEQNNDPLIALSTLEEEFNKKNIKVNNIMIATQNEKMEMVEV